MIFKVCRLMSYTRSEAIGVAQECWDVLRPLMSHHVVRAGVFGSYARGEQDFASDIDLLVLTQHSYPDFMDKMRLENAMFALLDRAHMYIGGQTGVQLTTLSEQEFANPPEAHRELIESIRQDLIFLTDL